jgi:hypothetical protein
VPRNTDISQFLARIGPELAASFTAEQLAAVELHFAMRNRPGHALDWRRRVGFGRRRGYVVVLAGWDKAETI